MKKIFCSLLLCTVIGCAPSLKDTMSVDVIPADDEIKPSTILSNAVTVRVERFNDSRVDTAIAEINGRKLSPEGDLGTTIKNGFERALRTQGAKISLFDAPLTITGEVTAWKLHVKPGFPVTNLEGKATVRANVVNKAGHVLYRGNYSGIANYQHPYPRQSAIENVLGRAMSEAIGAAMKDRGLVQVLKEQPQDDRTYREPPRQESQPVTPQSWDDPARNIHPDVSVETITPDYRDRY